MYYSTRNGSVNAILLIIIGISILVFVAWIGYNAGLNVYEGFTPSKIADKNLGDGIEIYLTPISLSENVGLEMSSGIAVVDINAGRIIIDVIAPEGFNLPENSVLEAWLVDAGKEGGIGESSVSEDDQRFGTPFSNLEFSERIDNAPFAHSVGKLDWNEERGSFHIFYEINNNFTPYGAVMITIESDGNLHNYDPRPGTPVLIGEIIK
jgi:hypothetical protein